MSQHVIALDQGTTSSRAIIFDVNGKIVSLSQHPFAQIYPQPGWVEHDPEEIWQNTLAVARAVTEKAGIDKEEIAALGLSNQRETSVCWDRRFRCVFCYILLVQRVPNHFCDALAVEAVVIEHLPGIAGDHRGIRQGQVDDPLGIIGTDHLGHHGAQAAKGRVLFHGDDQLLAPSGAEQTFSVQGLDAVHIQYRG